MHWSCDRARYVHATHPHPVRSHRLCWIVRCVLCGVSCLSVCQLMRVDGALALWCMLYVICSQLCFVCMFVIVCALCVKLQR
jgi:hypothetical protein